MLSTVCRKWRYLVKHLGTINLSFTRLEFLPDNLLDGCFRLRTLEISWCSKLMSLPAEIGNLTSLRDPESPQLLEADVVAGRDRESHIPRDPESPQLLEADVVAGRDRESHIPRDPESRPLLEADVVAGRDRDISHPSRPWISAPARS